jgi:hypothetical protein
MQTDNTDVFYLYNEPSFEIKDGDLDQDKDNIFVMPDGRTYGIMSPCWWKEKDGLEQELQETRNQLCNVQQELRKKEVRMCNLEQELRKKEDWISDLQEEIRKKEDRIRDFTQKILIKKTKHLSGFYRRKR